MFKSQYRQWNLRKIGVYKIEETTWIMKSGTAIIIAGIIMVVSGLVLFYSVQSGPDLDPLLRAVKHAGTFVGLMGIGVTMAGILLYLINRNQPTIQENFDTDMR